MSSRLMKKETRSDSCIELMRRCNGSGYGRGERAANLRRQDTISYNVYVREAHASRAPSTIAPRPGSISRAWMDAFWPSMYATVPVLYALVHEVRLRLSCTCEGFPGWVERAASSDIPVARHPSTPVPEDLIRARTRQLDRDACVSIGPAVVLPRFYNPILSGLWWICKRLEASALRRGPSTPVLGWPGWEMTGSAARGPFRRSRGTSEAPGDQDGRRPTGG